MKARQPYTHEFTRRGATIVEKIYNLEGIFSKEIVKTHKSINEAKRESRRIQKELGYSLRRIR